MHFLLNFRSKLIDFGTGCNWKDSAAIKVEFIWCLTGLYDMILNHGYTFWYSFLFYFKTHTPEYASCAISFYRYVATSLGTLVVIFRDCAMYVKPTAGPALLDKSKVKLDYLPKLHQHFQLTVEQVKIRSKSIKYL